MLFAFKYHLPHLTLFFSTVTSPLRRSVNLCCFFQLLTLFDSVLFLPNTSSDIITLIKGKKKKKDFIVKYAKFFFSQLFFIKSKLQMQLANLFRKFYFPSSIYSKIFFFWMKMSLTDVLIISAPLCYRIWYKKDKKDNSNIQTNA